MQAVYSLLQRAFGAVTGARLRHRIHAFEEFMALAATKKILRPPSSPLVIQALETQPVRGGAQPRGAVKYGMPRHPIGLGTLDGGIHGIFIFGRNYACTLTPPWEAISVAPQVVVSPACAGILPLPRKLLCAA
ncbi:hypothetical protein [Achromobacter spanius]|uniref:hypothetical protein n=1 Tax=Achromobacter spanius TaxID=217203 RepID=UPI00320967A3